MYKKITLILAVMAIALGVAAQREAEPAVDSSRWDFHLSTGTTVMSMCGKGNAYVWVAPSVDYHASDRLTLHGGFATVGSLLGGYELRGNVRSLAPVRRGTQLMGVTAGAEYQMNDRLNVWASLTYVGGWHEPLWSPFNESFNIGVSAFSGGFSYALSDDSLLEMHFHFVHDHYGNDAMGILGHPYYGYGVPCYELYGGPWPF